MDSLQTVEEEDGARALMGLSFGEIFVMIKQMELRHISSMTKITKLSSQLQVSRTRIEELNSEALACEAREKDYALELESLSETLIDSRQREEEGSRKIKDLTSELNEIQAREIENSAKLEDLGRLLSDTKRREKEGAFELEELKRALQESQTRETETVSENNDLRRKLTDSQNKEEAHASTVDDLNRQVHTSESHREELAVAIAGLKTTLQEKASANEHLNNELRDYKSKEELNVSLVKELRSTLQQVRDAKEVNMAAAVSDLQQQLEECREREQDSANKVEELSAHLQRSKENEKELATQCNDLNDQLQEKCAMHLQETKKNESGSLPTTKETSPPEHRVDSTELQDDARGTSGDIQALQKQLHENQEKLSVMEQHKQVAEGRVVELRSQLVHTQLLTKLHEDREVELRKALTESKKQVEILESKVVELRIELEENAENLEQCEKKLATTKSELAVSLSKLDEFTDANKSLNTLSPARSDDDSEAPSVSKGLNSEQNPTGEVTPGPIARRFFNFRRSSPTQKQVKTEENIGVGNCFRPEGTVTEALQNGEPPQEQTEEKKSSDEKPTTSSVGFFTFGFSTKNATDVGVDRQTRAAGGSALSNITTTENPEKTLGTTNASTKENSNIPTNAQEKSINQDCQEGVAQSPRNDASKTTSNSQDQFVEKSETSSMADLSAISVETENTQERESPPSVTVPPQSSFPKVTWQELSDGSSADDTSGSFSVDEKDTKLKHALHPLEPPSPLANVPLVSPFDDDGHTFTSDASQDDASLLFPLTSPSQNKDGSSSLGSNETTFVSSKESASMTSVTPDASVASKSPQRRSPEHLTKMEEGLCHL